GAVARVAVSLFFAERRRGLPRSELHFAHRRLILPLQVTIERDMLVNGQRLPPGMAGDQLQFGVGQAAVTGQERDGLVAERVRVGADAGPLGVVPDDLLDAASGVLRRLPAGEQVAILRPARQVRPQGRSEYLPK